ncbi:MAG: type I restriction enzyme S subunit [Motiliproteus sp.]
MSKKFIQTDIGRIPVGWEPYKVGELVFFSGGAQPDKSVFKYRSTKGYIRLIQIRDYKADKYETYIPEGLARKICDEDDVMIGRYGPPIFQILRGIKGAYNVALIKAKPSEKLDKEFFYHFIKNENLFSLMDSLSRRSSGQTGVELPALKEYPLPLPSKEEQTAIANALSDVDALITSLDKLITKKFAIKTAAMQQLLTGKKRLPPFDQAHTGYKQTELGEIPVDWEIVELETAVNFFDGMRKPVKSGDRAKIRGIYRYYGASGVVDYVNDYLFDGAYILLGEDGENILSRNLPLAFKVEGKFWINNHAHIMQPKIYFDIDYLTAFLESLDYSLLNSGTAQPKLNKQSCLTINVAKPERAEQKAIGNVLTDMDAEIDALAQRLTKTQNLKQGMMQELLTGRTRLV